jgi:hypothetical protein
MKAAAILHALLGLALVNFAFGAPVDGCLGGAAPPPGTAFEEAGESRYRLEATRSLRGGLVVEIRLGPPRGYHLNGPGYPALSLVLDLPPDPRAETEEGGILLNAPGVAEGESVTWLIEADPAISRISGTLRAILCGEFLCRPIAESVAIEIR